MRMTSGQRQSPDSRGRTWSTASAMTEKQAGGEKRIDVEVDVMGMRHAVINQNQSMGKKQVKMEQSE